MTRLGKFTLDPHRACEVAWELSDPCAPLDFLDDRNPKAETGDRGIRRFARKGVAPENGIPRKSSAGAEIAHLSCDKLMDKRTGFDTFFECPGMDLFSMT